MILRWEVTFQPFYNLPTRLGLGTIQALLKTAIACSPTMRRHQTLQQPALYPGHPPRAGITISCLNRCQIHAMASKQERFLYKKWNIFHNMTHSSGHVHTFCSFENNKELENTLLDLAIPKPMLTPGEPTVDLRLGGYEQMLFATLKIIVTSRIRGERGSGSQQGPASRRAGRSRQYTR